MLVIVSGIKYNASYCFRDQVQRWLLFQGSSTTLIIVSGIKYNAEKEEKERQEGKQKKLRALEEAKKIEAEKGKHLNQPMRT